jgi:hypothetical protein
MARTWVLDTETKGTGAEMVPLEKVLRAPDAAPRSLPARPRPRPAPAPQPRAAPRFRVIDVLTGEVAVERASTRETVALLERRRSVVDVTLDVWDPEESTWRRLTHAERKVLWGLRGRAREVAPGASAAGGT